MPMSPLLASTLQSALLGGISNIIAQALTARSEGVELAINWIPVLQFLLFSAIVTPPNFLWQSFLEKMFPGYPPAPHPKKSDDKPPPPQLSKRNTAVKLVLDQTVGAAVNTLLFSVFNRSIQAALGDAPVITNIFKAFRYWVEPFTIDFERVDFDEVWQIALDEFWPILTAGWKVWPFVALFNFTMVKTVQGRNLVGGLAGVGWGTYMSLIAAS